MNHDPNDPNQPEDSGPAMALWVLLPAFLMVCLAAFGGYKLAAYIFGG